MKDLISEALSSLRINGSVLLRESYVSPWAINIPDQNSWRSIMKIPAAARVVPFHVVESGQCTIKLTDGESVLLNKGDIAICFGGGAHNLAMGRGARSKSIVSLLNSPQRKPTNTNAGASSTSLLCGIFFLHQVNLNPLFSSLPLIIKADSIASKQQPALDALVRLLSQMMRHSEPANDYKVSRLLEVLCAEVICSYIAGTKTFKSGWLRGLADPLINQVITAIHLNPAFEWSLNILANRVSLSDSRFAARFVEVTGKSPMAYLLQWRMLLAQERLITSPMSIEQVATHVGYENVAAFNRAFKKLVGVTPTQWRVRES